MKDENHHIVRTQQYQIQLEDEKDTYAFQTKVSQLQYRVINDLLDRILSDYSEKGYLIQFNEVVLDLGTMDSSNWENEIAYRIEEQLTRFLQSAIWENGTLRTGKKIKIRHHDVEMLEHFLLHGYVSWNHPVHTRPVILFSQLISQQDKSLSVLLNNLGKKEVVRKRLISQFDDATLDKTVLAVTDNQQQYIIRYREQITMYHKENKLADTSTGNFRNALWEIILAFVFTETTGYYNKKIFVKYILEKIAQKYRIAYTVLLNTMHHAMIEHRQKMYSDVEFEKMISELYQEDTRQEILYPETDSTESKNRLKFIEVERILNYFLQHGSVPLNCGIKDIEDLFLKIGKESMSNIPVQLTKLMHQAHELLASLPLIADTAVSQDVVDSIFILQKRTLTSSEEYFNNVMGIPALSIFLKTLNGCINRYTNDVAVRKELIQLISLQALSIHLEVEVLIERLIVFLKGNLCKPDWKFISPDLLFYLDIMYVGSTVDTAVQTNAAEQAFDEQFMQEPINRLLFRINAAMFANREQNNYKHLADEILRQYVSTYGINRVLLVQQLKMILNKQRSYFPAQVIHKDLMAYLIERAGKQVQSIDTASFSFSLDLLGYYAAYGKLPFWAQSTDLFQLRLHLERLAKRAPDMLRDFLKDNGRTLMERAPHEDYLLVLRSFEYTDVVPDFVFQIQILIEKCISQKLVSVWPEAKKLRRFFRRFFLEQILCNGSILKNKEKLIKFCIHEIEENLALDAGEILQLLIQKKEDLNGTYSYDDPELLVTYAATISSLSVIEKNKSTEENHLKPEDADLLQLFEMFNDKTDVVLQDRAYLFNRIVAYSKANPYLFLEHLRQLTIRRAIVENISRRNFVQLLFMHVDDHAKKIIQAYVILFKHIQKFLTVTQSHALWKLYAEALLMKLAIDGGSLIREKDVAWIFYKSMIMIFQKNKTVAILRKLDTMIMSVPLAESERKLLKRIQSGFEKQITAQTEKISLNTIQKKNKVLTEEDLMGESIFLSAAGVVILGPFIPMLFTKVNVVNAGAFINDVSRIRGVQLLHYAVFGNRPMEESDTVLFKLLCGMDLESPLETDTVLSEEEQQLIDGLLNTVIQQWSILKSTSLDGLRETFLKREGKLQIEEEEYILHVVHKAYDMLLDHIPWSISKIKFSWMKKMISVQWRQ